MEAKRQRARWSYAEFARLPTSGSTRYEIIDDELVVTPSPGTRHQRIVSTLVRVLGNHVVQHDLGEVFVGPFDVLFDEGDYLEPDLLFVGREHEGLLSDRGVEGPPDLVVEVLSPSTAGRDRGVKLGRYRHYGVAEYWIVDPEARAFEVWRLAEGAVEAEVYGPDDTFAWTPERDGPTLELRPGEVIPEG